MRVTLLSGGGGGARFARGLASIVRPGELTVVANVGDDVEILGLRVSPDLDSVLYALAGLLDDERGWGRKDETWRALESVGSWGGEDWFRLGDLDLGIHLVRTAALRDGARVSEVTARLAERAGIASKLLPATDDDLRTYVVTAAGTFPFQEWFVGRGHADEVDSVAYEGAVDAGPAPGVIEALERADAILVAPSNPYLSIGPILAVSAIRASIEDRSVPCVAVSPLIGGRSVTGPLDRMLTRMTGGTTPAHVLDRYRGLIDALVIDETDASSRRPDDVRVVVARTLMHDLESENRLARLVLEAACG